MKLAIVFLMLLSGCHSVRTSISCKTICYDVSINLEVER